MIRCCECRFCEVEAEDRYADIEDVFDTVILSRFCTLKFDKEQGLYEEVDQNGTCKEAKPLP